MATVCHDTVLGAATRAIVRDTACAHGLGAGCVAIQPVTQPARPATRHGQDCDTVGLGHDTVGEGATSRPSGRHDTGPSALCAGLGAVRS